MSALVETPSFSSASGLMSFLEEDDAALQAACLTKLLSVVDEHWAEIADAVAQIEELAETPSFAERELAALLASKCYYHLEAYDDAMRLALAAGARFSVDDDSLFGQTLVGKCVDKYLSLRAAIARGGDDAPEMPPRLEAVAEQMLTRCFRDGRYGQALGIALEAQRLDVVEQAIVQSPDVDAMLASCQRVVQEVAVPKEFRRRVVDQLVGLHRTRPQVDSSAVCQLLQFLDRPEEVAAELDALLYGEDSLLALQVAFDLCDNEDQRFLQAVDAALPSRSAAPAPAPEDEATPGSATPGEAGEGEGEGSAAAEGETPAAAAAPAPAPADDDGEGEAEGKEQDPPEGAPADYWARSDRLRKVLTGGFPTELLMYFLYRNNNTDNLILKRIKQAAEHRSSVLHGATVMAHALMNSGTTVDMFLRNNLEWLARANNWAKFSATASIGVVHKGHVTASLQLLEPYLPSEGAQGSPYSEGGALYALGLIHANNGGSGDSSIIEYLENALRNAGGNETVIHGACLGLGLAAMGTRHEGVFSLLKDSLFSESAVAGEAAGLAMGLLLVGTGGGHPLAGECLEEMLTYAHETKHEKIIRAISMAVALIHFGQEEDADAVIEQLSRDRDALLRYGAMYTLGLAYCGTGSNSAIRRLLHVAVSDVSDDVRRAAVTCLGLVMFRSPDKVPALLSLLSESFNAHVRYGTCMAVGIACAGSSMPDAVAFLEPMLKDQTDFVRQGALVALSMVLMTDTEARNPKVKTVRDKLTDMLTDKTQTVMAKMGAILGTGLLDAGGRNVAISLQSRAGFTRQSAAVGLALWAQYWYWFPLQHMLTLALQPVAVIGLTGELHMPADWSVDCGAKASVFAYPEKLVEKKDKSKERVATAVLSTTAKAKARAARKEAEKNGGEATPSGSKEGEGSATTEGEGEGEGEAKEAKEPEPDTHQLANPARVTATQRELVSWADGQRYVPVRPAMGPFGIVVLRDTRPDEPQDLIAMRTPEAGEEPEADPPEPFEWEPPATEE